MITALILAERGGEALGVTLASLVPAVVAGIVGDAVLIAPRQDASVETIADGVGASLVALPHGSDPWRAGAAVARRDWLLCLEDGDVLADGWMRPLERFLATASATDPAVARLRRSSAGRAAAVRTAIERWAGTRRPRAGDLVHRAWLDGARQRVRPVAIRARIERDPDFG
ncbi:MAG TPA: hypothetical protein VH743_05160 [Beijerinckiaceae bacterium]|jgi:hypothetical protein